MGFFWALGKVEEEGLKYERKKDGGMTKRFSEATLLHLRSAINSSALNELPEEVSD